MGPHGVDIGVSVILALPTSLQIDLFTNWSCLKDIAMLDAALCNHAQRAVFSSTLQEPHCIFGQGSVEELDVMEELASWIVCRNLQIVGDVGLPMDLSDEQVWANFFETTGASLHTIRYPHSFCLFDDFDSDEITAAMTFVVDKAATCPNLKELTIYRLNPEVVDISPVLTHCSQLKTLKLLFSYELDLKCIHELGGSIETLDVSFYKVGGRRSGGWGSSNVWNEYSEDYEPIKYTPTSTLRKFICLHHYTDDLKPITNFLFYSTGLRELYIDKVSWVNVGCLIGRCPELTTVRVNDTYVQYEMHMDEDLDCVIESSKSVRYLQLVARQGEQDALFNERQLSRLLRGWLQLVALVLHDFKTIRWVEDEQPLPLPLPLPLPVMASPASSCLQVLHVKAISLSALQEVFALCPQLVELGIAEPVGLEEVLSLVVSHNVRRLLTAAPEDCALLLQLKNMEALSLTDCATLTSVQLLQIAKNNPHLTSLIVKGCSLITIDILDDLVSELAELKRLVLNDEKTSVREDLLDELRESCPQLKEAKVGLAR